MRQRRLTGGRDAPGRWVRCLALALALASGLTAAAGTSSMASTQPRATATLANVINDEGAGRSVKVLTVTNDFTAALTKLATSGGAERVLPTSSCTTGEAFSCTLDVAPGTSAAICIVGGSNFTAEAAEVTFANGERESIEPRSAPEVAHCPLGSVKESSGHSAKCVVPKLEGKKLAAAKSALKSAHCAVGKIRNASSKHVRQGFVISQSPAAGKSLPSGTAVSFTVSKGG
jgi:PASTA domain